MAKGERDNGVFGWRRRKSTQRAPHVRTISRDNKPGVANPASMASNADSSHYAVREAEAIVESVFPQELYRADVLAQRQRRRRIATVGVGAAVVMAGIGLVAELINSSNPSEVLIPDGSSSHNQVSAFSGGGMLQLADGTSTVPVLTDIPVGKVQGKTVESYLKDGSILIVDIGKNGAISRASVLPSAYLYLQ